VSVAAIPPGLPPIESVSTGAEVGRATRADKTDLGSAFGDALKTARGLEQDATTAAEKFADGDPSVGIHEVVIASEKANISVRFATTMKNKALEAYRELMNTQV
jgi:flagellar hook-basal body complex protein FliE